MPKPINIYVRTDEMPNSPNSQFRDITAPMSPTNQIFDLDVPGNKNIVDAWYDIVGSSEHTTKLHQFDVSPSPDGKHIRLIVSAGGRGLLLFVRVHFSHD